MTKNLPLVRLSAINPLFLELERRGLNVGPLLHEQGLPVDVPVSSDLFVPSDTIYELVEHCGDLAEDTFFGFTVGSRLDLLQWEPTADAAKRAKTVGEMLTLFAVNACEHSSATEFYVSTDGERSTFGFERVKPPTIVPAHNDAFYMGFMLRLLRHATREKWRAEDVLFRVSDPKCVPANGDAYRVAQGDTSGVRISFPSTWLFEPFERSQFKSGFEREQAEIVPRSLIDSLRSALQPHLHETDLSADKAAKICGFDRRRLSRELREAGTTLTREVAKLRSDAARTALSGSNEPIAKIAERVGYTDPTIFSRAFKKWTGQSPREYRRTRRSSESPRSLK